MEDDFGAYNEGDEHQASLKRFEKMLELNEQYFFDVTEYESVIDHYLENNLSDKAEKAITFSLLQHPSATVLQLKKAQLYSNLHQPNKALEILNRIEKIEPFNQDIHLVKAAINSQLRAHNKAIESYYKALKLVTEDSEKVNIQIHIAFEYENLNQYDKAIDILKHLLKENPNNETVIYELAFCYNLKNDTANSILFFKEFIDEYPYNYSAWYNLGIAYSRAELYEKAIVAYDYTLAIKEDFSSAYFNKGNALSHLEQFKEAIYTYRDTFNFEEPDATTYYYIGECFEKLGEYHNAASSYQKATKIDPFYADAWAGSAVINETLNKNQAAEFHIKKALELEDNNPEYWYIYGDILAKMGLIDDALKIYLKVTELDEEIEEIWLDIAEIVSEHESLENGIVYLEKGIKKQPLNYLIYARLVAYLLKIGKEQEAIKNMLIILTNNDAEETKILIDELASYYPNLFKHNEITQLIENYNNL